MILKDRQNLEFFSEKGFWCLCCYVVGARGFLSAVFVNSEKQKINQTKNQKTKTKQTTKPQIKPQWYCISLYLHLNTSSQNLKFSSSRNTKEKDSNVPPTWNTDELNHIYQEIQNFQEHFLLFMSVFVKMCTMY